MDKAIILSVKPHYADKILAGDKTLEIRKRNLLHLSGATAFIYATAPVQAIIGGFRIGHVAVRKVGGVDKASTHAAYRAWGEEARIGEASFHRYMGRYRGRLSALTVHDAWTLPKPLFAIDLRGFKPPQSWRYAKPNEILEISQAMEGI